MLYLILIPIIFHLTSVAPVYPSLSLPLLNHKYPHFCSFVKIQQSCLLPLFYPHIYIGFTFILPSFYITLILPSYIHLFYLHFILMLPSFYPHFILINYPRFILEIIYSHSSCHAFPAVLRDDIIKKDENCRLALNFWPHWLRPPWFNNEPTNMGTCWNESVAHVPTRAPLCSGKEAAHAAREECNDRERARYNDRQGRFDKRFTY